MSKSLMLSLLGRANNGNELLSVLDVISEGDDSNNDQAQPTLDPIDF